VNHRRRRKRVVGLETENAQDLRLLIRREIGIDEVRNIRDGIAIVRHLNLKTKPTEIDEVTSIEDDIAIVLHPAPMMKKKDGGSVDANASGSTVLTSTKTTKTKHSVQSPEQMVKILNDPDHSRRPSRAAPVTEAGETENEREIATETKTENEIRSDHIALRTAHTVIAAGIEAEIVTVIDLPTETEIDVVAATTLLNQEIRTGTSVQNRNPPLQSRKKQQKSRSLVAHVLCQWQMVLTA
jgi:hypothetical protein